MKRNYHTDMAFLDLLFNTLLCFAALFVLAFVLINPSQEQNNVESKAEFLITITWPEGMDNDVDVYVEDPVGHLVAFMRREDGLMHLDRDDLGQRNDVIQTPFGSVESNENKEIVTLRGIVPGEYVVNVHMYMERANAQATPVTIQLEKLNPYRMITLKERTLTITGDEKTAFRFTLDRSGEVIEVNELPKTLLPESTGTL